MCSIRGSPLIARQNEHKLPKAGEESFASFASRFMAVSNVYRIPEAFHGLTLKLVMRKFWPGLDVCSIASVAIVTYRSFMVSSKYGLCSSCSPNYIHDGRPAVFSSAWCCHRFLVVSHGHRSITLICRNCTTRGSKRLGADFPILGEEDSVILNGTKPSSAGHL